MSEQNRSEIERITAVYRGYREEGKGNSKWGAHQPGNRAMMLERQCALKKMLGALGLHSFANKKLLEIGCGSGQVLELFSDLGFSSGNLYGVDLLPDRIAEAKQRCPGFNLQQANAERLPFPDGFFDFLSAFTVFSSILDESMARNVVKECRRVLRMGGALVWYDFRVNNPGNPNVRGIGLPQIRQLFGQFVCHFSTLTLLPPLARRLGFLTHILYPVLAGFPFLRTHYLAILLKPDNDDCC